MKKAIHGGGGLYASIGFDFNDISKNITVVNADGLDAWFDPCPQALTKVVENILFAIKTSPPVHATGLVEAIACARKLPKENLLVSGGSSDLMYQFFPNLNAKKVLILDPMYGEYKHIFENVIKKVELFKFNLSSEHNFIISTEELIKNINEIQPDLVVIVNPNSPTGKYLEKKSVIEILDAIPKETLFVIDETYIDYAGTDQSAETLVTEHKNLVIIKSMSKVYSLSGARVAYLVADTEIIKKIDMFIPPFQVSLPAQIMAIEALKDSVYYKKMWDETDVLRSKILADLKDISTIKIYSGVGNFFLVELLGVFTGKASEIVRKLSDENIFIRNARSMSDHFDENFIRIAVRDSRSNEKIVTALKRILK